MKNKKFSEILKLLIIILIILVLKFTVSNEKLQSFSLIFASILFEAMPFILIGSIISSLISVYVSSDLITRLTPQNDIIGIILMSLLGIVFPLCECSIVPITRQLINKKLTKSMAIAFMLSVPVVNPIVFFSTYYAFQSLNMAILRMSIGIISGIIIGILVHLLIKEDEITKAPLLGKCSHHSHDHDHVCCDHNHHHDESKLVTIISHTMSEFISMGKYVVLGSFISALIQVALPAKTLLNLGHMPFVSVLAMMTLAYILSICSEADAFIAKGFMTSFSKGSILSFLTFGPMLDLKNTLMIFASFKKSVALKICCIIVVYHLVLGQILYMIGV